METLLLLVVLLITTTITSSSYCSRELKYHEQYDGYGSDIICEHLTNKDSNLMHLASYKPTYLQIKDSNITKATPKLFSSVEPIKIFEIRNSTFLFDHSENPFKLLKHLEELTIEDSVVGEVSEATFQTFRYLTELRLKNVNIDKLPKNSLAQLKKLHTLDLSRNKFRAINVIPICEVPHLRKINLEMNEIEHISSSTFGCKTSEDSLEFDVNSFKNEVTVHAPLFYDTGVPMNHLYDINLSHNKLNTLASAFAGLSSLKYLNLEGNRIDNIDRYEFSSLEKLLKLNLGSNLLRSINETVFENFLAIKQIILDNNQLTYIKLDNLVALKYLNLGNNSISVNCIEKWRKLPNLMHLNLSGNKIQYLPPNTFKSIENVTLLDLSANNLTLQNDTFKYLQHLTDLNISNNNLTTVPFGIFETLKELQNLDLSYNTIEEFNFAGIFGGQKNLRSLNISYNHLEYVNKQMFAPLKSLSTLDIEGNRLKMIDVEIISELPYLKIINIRNNRFSCEFLTDLLKFLQTKNILYSTTMEVNVTSENVGGISCSESKNAVIAANLANFAKSVVVPDHIKASLPRISKEPAKSSGSTIATTTVVSVVAILSVLGYLLYKYRKRKKNAGEHFELIGD